MLNKYGTFFVRAYTAGGALPVSGAIVRIRGADENNREVVYSLITDEDGVTEKIRLPAPPKELSDTPEQTEPPYALYDIEIVKNGYFTKRLYNIQVFSETENEQLIAMIPYSSVDENYPKGNINANQTND